MSFMTTIKSLTNRLTGGGREYSITVPVMDGPMKPNDLIEEATLLATVDQADNITAYNGGFLLSSGGKLLHMNNTGKITNHSEHMSRITALAVSSSGLLAIGLAENGVAIVDDNGSAHPISATSGLKCITALCYLEDGTLIATNGSESFAAGDWVHDLVHLGASGSVVSIAPDQNALTVLAKNLSFPAGVCAIHGKPDQLAVTECWKHRVIEISLAAKRVTGVLLDQLPSYPARILQLADNSYALTNYSVRSQMIEFILHEKRYLRRMIAEVPSDYWIAPSLSSGHSFKEPLQAGGVIRLGIHKPWAPSRSYGLLLRLDGQFQPVSSAHSRANGSRHGVTAAAEFDGALIAASQGNGNIVKIIPEVAA